MSDSVYTHFEYGCSGCKDRFVIDGTETDTEVINQLADDQGIPERRATDTYTLVSGPSVLGKFMCEGRIERMDTCPRDVGKLADLAVAEGLTVRKSNDFLQF